MKQKQLEDQDSDLSDDDAMEMDAISVGEDDDLFDSVADFRSSKAKMDEDAEHGVAAPTNEKNGGVDLTYSSRTASILECIDK